MKRGWLIIGGISLLGVALYKYFKTQADLLLQFTWDFKAFKIRKFSLNELAIDLSILFKSKSSIEAKITKLYFDALLEGKNVGFIMQDQPFIIPANGSATIPLYISVNPKAVFGNIIDLSLGAVKNKDIKLTLVGYAKVESGFFKTTLPIEYDISLKEYMRYIKP